MGGMPSPRTVLFAHPSAELYGSDLQLVETVRGCVDAGATAVVVIPAEGDLGPLLRDAGARVVVLPMPVLRKALLTPAGMVRLAVQAARALPGQVRLVRRTGAGVVLVNTQTIPTWLVAGRLAGARVVSHVHEAEADATRALRWGLAAPLLLAHHVVANSRFAREVVVRAVPRLARRTTVIYNGVPGPGPVAEPGPSPVKDHALVALVGRLSPRKGTDVALEAVARLRAAGRDVRIVLCGSAFAGYEWFEQQLRDRAARPDLDGAVTFAGYADPWEWFERADVVVVPSRVEPFGNVAVQGMLARRPVIASRTQGLAEIVRDHETGLAVPPEDDVALADAVARLLDDGALADRLAGAARKEALERFDVDRYRALIAREVMGLATPDRENGSI